MSRVNSLIAMAIVMMAASCADRGDHSGRHHQDGDSEARDLGPRDYVMKNAKTGETVSCGLGSVRRHGEAANPPDQGKPEDCIAMCKAAGFHGNDPNLEFSVGYEISVPDRATQIKWNIPKACQI